MTTTLYLDPVTWDLATDEAGNILIASEPYRVAQDVASAVRLFRGEYWYDTSLGVPYWQQILGFLPNASVIKAALAAAASTVPGCNNPVVYLSGLSNRGLSGQIQFTDANGVQQAVSF